jgi:hypothetical protein
MYEFHTTFFLRLSAIKKTINIKTQMYNLTPRLSGNLIVFNALVYIQGVCEIRVLILTSGRSRQFLKFSSITFFKFRKNFPKFFAPLFLPNGSFCVIN